MTITDSSIASPSPDQVRSDLVAGVMRHNHRRRSRQRLAVAGAVAVIGFGSFGLIDTSDPAFAVMQQPNGLIEVEIFPELDEVDDLERALGDVGLEATIVNLAAHPSLVGVVEVTGHENQSNGSMRSDDGTFMIDPSQVTGPVEVLVYSDAGDAQYQAAPSVFSPGQELAGLHCAYDDRPLTTEALEQHATAAGIANIEWWIFGEMNADTFEVEADVFDDRPDGFVDGAHLIDEDTLTVFATIDNERPAAQSIVMYDGTHSESDPECTPELAARWR